MTHPQSSASRARTFRPVHVLRNHATLARVIQIKTLVGRRIQANAASQRQRRRLHAFRWSALSIHDPPKTLPVFSYLPTCEP